MLTIILTIIATFIAMEGVAWGMHKYVMHGPGWIFHEDHHIKEPGRSWVERNDVFFIFFASIAITCLRCGPSDSAQPL